VIRLQVAQATGRTDELERADLLGPFLLLGDVIPKGILVGGGIAVSLASLVGLAAIAFVTRRRGAAGPGIFLTLFWIIFPALGAGVWINLPTIALIAEACVLSALVLSLAPELKKVYFSVKPVPTARTLVSVVGAVLGCFVLVHAVNFGYELLYEWLVGDSLGMQWVALYLKCDNAYDAAVMFFMVAICAPVIEEIAFRGFLVDWLLRRMAWVGSILCASFIFAIIHGWTVAVPIFFVGLAAGWLRFRFKSLWPSVLLHMLNNGVAVIALWVVQ
jgi:membrane protease YdiL (CAAX protease family)